MDIYEVLESIRSLSPTEREKGQRFEKVVQCYFKTSSIYESIISDVWMWNEFPYRGQFDCWQIFGHCFALQYIHH